MDDWTVERGIDKLDQWVEEGMDRERTEGWMDGNIGVSGRVEGHEDR